MTWTAWVYAAANLTSDGQIISKSNSSTGWQLKTSTGTGAQTFAVSVTSSSGTALRNSTTARALNTWYHVAGVYNATTKTLDI